MKSVLFFVIVMVVFMCAGSDQKKFNSLWYDGNAEISTYSLEQFQYGETRQGTRVMVFVTEPMRLENNIKPDVRLADELMVRVIKLNDHRHFVTGIYDYTVMTSVFTSVENKKPYGNMATMKVAFSSQEWCGMVFERIIRKPGRYEGSLYSYFETPGEQSYHFSADKLQTEDNLWIRVRELNGPFLKEGESKEITLLPSRWILRKTHQKDGAVEAVVSKGQSQKRSTSLGEIDVMPFSWTIDTAVTTVWVEKAYPRRIVEFCERDGSSGKLIVSRREPYWKQSSNEFLHLRQELGLE